MAAQQQAVARPGTAQGGSANLADVLERVLDKGIVIAGDIKLLLADIEVLTLQIRLVVCSVDKAREIGLDWWTNHPSFGPYKKREERELRGSSMDKLEKRLDCIEQSLAGKQAAQTTVPEEKGTSHS